MSDASSDTTADGAEAAPVILVTGASRGLGRATAEILGRRGAVIIAVARTVGGLEELDDAIRQGGGPSALLVPMDIADGDALDQLGAALFDRYGRLDGVIHAAAEGPTLGPVSTTSPKDAARVFEVNAMATHRLIRSLDPLLRAAPSPRLIFVADNKTDQPFWSAYAGAKAAGRTFAQAYAREQKRVFVEIFRPDAMPTALRARSHPGEDRSALSPVAEQAERLAAAYDRLGAAP